MRWTVLCLSLLVCACAALPLAPSSSVNASSPLVRLVVAYCPTAFTGAGAVVDVDETGKYTIVHRFKWPSSAVYGCPADVDPNDVVVGKNAYIDFVDDWGEVSVVDLTSGSVTKSIKAHSPVLFDGFTSMDLVSVDGQQYLQGPNPHVEQHGWCSDGCFQFGRMSVSTGDYSQLGDIPYKAIMTDTHFADHENHLFYIQASYPLAPNASCSKDQTDDCLVTLDTQTGEMVSTKKANNFTVYKYSTVKEGNKVLSWVFGFESLCKHPYNDFAFAWVDLKEATAEFIACIPKDITVDTNPMISSFSPDGSVFAQASGNAETGQIQLLVLDSHKGTKVLNSDLSGLMILLGGSSEVPFVDIWSVAFM